LTNDDIKYFKVSYDVCLNMSDYHP